MMSRHAFCEATAASNDEHGQHMTEGVVVWEVDLNLEDPGSDPCTARKLPVLPWARHDLSAAPTSQGSSVGKGQGPRVKAITFRISVHANL